MLILSIPAVQTSLGKKATKRINEDFGTNIQIGKVGLQFNGDVELKNIFIEDYKKDSLISIKELNTSILSFRNLYNGKLVFGDIDIMDLVFNVKTYAGEDQTNLDVFVAKFDEDNPNCLAYLPTLQDAPDLPTAARDARHATAPAPPIRRLAPASTFQ